MDIIKDILLKHNYIVNFDKISTNRFSIKTPKRILEPKRAARELTVTTNNQNLSVYEDGGLVNTIEVGDIGIRVGIYYLLTGICRSIGYSPSHVLLNNELGNTINIIEMLPSLKIDLVNKENILTSLISAYVENSLNIEELLREAKENDLEDNFMKVISLEQFFTKGQDNE